MCARVLKDSQEMRLCLALLLPAPSTGAAAMTAAPSAIESMSVQPAPAVSASGLRTHGERGAERMGAREAGRKTVSAGASGHSRVRG